jgi:hypothetical protein
MPSILWDLDHKHEDDEEVEEVEEEEEEEDDEEEEEEEEERHEDDGLESTECSKLVPAIIISQLTGGPGRP